MDLFEFEQKHGCSPDPGNWRKDHVVRELEDLAQNYSPYSLGREISYALMAADRSLCQMVNGVDTMKYIGSHLSPEAQSKIFPYAPQLDPNFAANRYLPRLNLEFKQ